MKNFKYIVYETTNTVNNKIYIGIHRTEDPNTFDGYIGCGVYKMWPYTYEHAKTAFQYAVKKYGPDKFVRKTLAVFDTEKEASDLEEQLVNEEFLARTDVYNMVLGGLGGYFVTNREKACRYTLTGEFIEEYDSYAIAAINLNCDYTLISYAVRKKCVAKNSLWTNEKVDKLDVSRFNLGLNHAKKVSAYTKEGKFIATYKTQAEASRELNVGTSSIRNGCLLGNCVKDTYYFCYLEKDTYDVARCEYLKVRTVYQYSKEGEFIKEYNTQLEAEYDNPGSNISKSIRLKILDENDYLWSLEKLPNYNSSKCNAKRKVAKYDLEGNLVQIYNSATAAEKENGTSVWKVLNGTNKTHKNHIYKYLDES